MKRTITRLLALAGVMAVAAGIGVASATIPSSGGRIFGCFAKNGGALRIVQSGQSCKGGEQPLFWNQQGPKGDPGPAGGAGAGKLVSRTAVSNDVPPGHGSLSVSCKPGERATGGGFGLGTSLTEDLRVAESTPLPGLAGWRVEFDNRSGHTVDADVTAICAS